jgi:cytochrome c oxidase assembly protein subunit 15
MTIADRASRIEQGSLRKLAVFAAVLAFVVVVFGAYVRLKDAGLGCPDWPGCYGQLTVPGTPEARIAASQNFPKQPLETSKAWIEMTHRYLAGTLGVIVLAIALVAWRRRPAHTALPWLSTLLLALVGFQALIGMWTVTLLLKPAIVTLHLLGGMMTLALLMLLVLASGASPSRASPRRDLRLIASLGLVILFLQITLGGWVSANHAALACADFPRCRGLWMPPMDFEHGFQIFRELGMTAQGTALSNEALNSIQWAHRLGALVSVIYLSALGIACLRVPGLRRYGALVLVVVWIQGSLGVANVVMRLPLVLAVAHNAVAALLLISMVMLNFHVYRMAGENKRWHRA